MVWNGVVSCYCIVLHDMVVTYGILYGMVWYCMVSYGIV